jgi:hypothetical protein
VSRVRRVYFQGTLVHLMLSLPLFRCSMLLLLPLDRMCPLINLFSLLLTTCCMSLLQRADGQGVKRICRYGEAPASAASWRAHDSGRQQRTACPLLYRYRLTHTYCSLARLPPTHPFVGAPILQRHFQVRWRVTKPYNQTLNKFSMLLEVDCQSLACC